MMEVRVEDPAAVDVVLNKALATVMDAATRYGAGVMIARTAPGHYVVLVRHNPRCP